MPRQRLHHSRIDPFISMLCEELASPAVRASLHYSSERIKTREQVDDGLCAGRVLPKASCVGIVPMAPW